MSRAAELVEEILAESVARAKVGRKLERVIVNPVTLHAMCRSMSVNRWACDVFAMHGVTMATAAGLVSVMPDPSAPIDYARFFPEVEHPYR